MLETRRNDCTTFLHEWTVCGIPTRVLGWIGQTILPSSSQRGCPVPSQNKFCRAPSCLPMHYRHHVTRCENCRWCFPDRQQRYTTGSGGSSLLVLVKFWSWRLSCIQQRSDSNSVTIRCILKVLVCWVPYRPRTQWCLCLASTLKAVDHYSPVHDQFRIFCRPTEHRGSSL